MLNYVNIYLFCVVAPNVFRQRDYYIERERETTFVVALEGGPHPGGVVHPPNPRGWLLEEARAIR